jgi:hypothetical protein
MRKIHLLEIRRNGKAVYWVCTPEINVTGYLRPLSETSTFAYADVTCPACRAIMENVAKAKGE